MTRRTWTGVVLLLILVGAAAGALIYTFAPKDGERATLPVAQPTPLLLPQTRQLVHNGQEAPTSLPASAYATPIPTPEPTVTPRWTATPTPALVADIRTTPELAHGWIDDVVLCAGEFAMDEDPMPRLQSMVGVGASSEALWDTLWGAVKKDSRRNEFINCAGIQGWEKLTDWAKYTTGDYEARYAVYNSFADSVLCFPERLEETGWVGLLAQIEDKVVIPNYFPKANPPCD